MIEPRIYRAALLPAVIALVLVGFSLQDAPGPVGQPLAADALFDGTGATALLHEIVQSAPDRRPGSRGDATVGAQVANAFRTAGFVTTIDRFSSDRHTLSNVVGTRPGDTPRELVVVAGRDARGVPGAVTSAADTAALMQFAHVFQGTAAHHTLVLASLDGTTLGDAGARRFVQTVPDPGDVDAVIAISNLAADRSRGPLVDAWSADAHRGSVSLERTAISAIRYELGGAPPRPPMLAQLARLAFPISPGAQAPLLAHGLETVRISGSGELDARRERLTNVNSARYGNLGRAALRTILALDPTMGRPPHGPRSYLQVSQRVLPGWAISVLAFALLLPPLVASVDALARAARRREAISAWIVWLIAGALSFGIGLGAGKLLVVSGLGPDAPAAPLDPSSVRLDAASLATLAVTVAVTALAWFLVRPRAIAFVTRIPAASEPGAGVVAALALSVTGTALTATDPYTGVVIASAVNLLMLVSLTGVRPAGALALAAAGLAPLAAVAAYYMVHFTLEPLHAAVYALLLVLGGVPGTWPTLALMVALGTGASIAAIVRARRRTASAEASAAAGHAAGQPILGPGGYAGPGLRETGSAIKR